MSTSKVMRTPFHGMSVVVSGDDEPRLSKKVSLIHVKEIKDDRYIGDLLGSKDEILSHNYSWPVEKPNFTALTPPEIKKLTPPEKPSTTSETTQADDTPDDGGEE